MMVAVSTSETSVSFYENTRLNIQNAAIFTVFDLKGGINICVVVQKYKNLEWIISLERNIK
jgi:hypothetical protein